jgi:hypothetical protein
MTFPEDLTAREAYILEQVQIGAYEARWSTVTSSIGTASAVFIVMADALKVEGVRVNVSAKLEQQLADTLNCSLLTPKLADLIWLQSAVRAAPYPRQITSSTQAMIEHSQKLDKLLVSLGNPIGLLSTVGKHWVLDKALTSHPGYAENYGWHFSGASFQGITGEVVATLTKDPKTGAYYRLIQGCGWAHDIHHADYSQTCVLVSKQCWVNGTLMNLEDVLADANLAPLAAHNGITPITRQPGVDQLISLVQPLTALPVGLESSNQPADYPDWYTKLLNDTLGV